MTVIAWDGKTLAADRQSTNSGLVTRTKKLRVLRGHLVGGSGDAAHVLEHMAWFGAGANPHEFPAHLRDDKLPSWLLVISPDGQASYYENGPYALEISEPFCAIGSGRDFALSAMHLGKSAEEAVRVAIELTNTCGLGIDTLELRRS